MADEQFPAAATALEEYQSIEEQMASPEVVSNPDKLRKLGRVTPNWVPSWVLQSLVAGEGRSGSRSGDGRRGRRLRPRKPSVLKTNCPVSRRKLRTALDSRVDPDDARDTIMEIKAGTGGEEAALFAGDLLRMYTRYAEKRGWSVNVQSENTTSSAASRTCRSPSAPRARPLPKTACGLR